MKRTTTIGLLLMLAGIAASQLSEAKGDDFGAAVKIIEKFYNVKHKSLPFLARAGMKVATTAARISGGDRKRIAEMGSVKVAFFEDQDFSSEGRAAAFKSAINSALVVSWSPLVQTISAKDEEQNYVYLREAKEKVQVLIVSIDRRDAVVVQATINPDSLARLMQNPEETGRAIANEATINDN